jgi:hypothetical protein
VYRVLQQKKYLRRKYMNKKVYVANLPSQAGEPELNALFSKAELKPGGLMLPG